MPLRVHYSPIKQKLWHQIPMKFIIFFFFKTNRFGLKHDFRSSGVPTIPEWLGEIFYASPLSPKQHIWKAVVPPTHSSSPWIWHIYNFTINIIETQRSGGLQRECDLSLILSPQQRKSELADVPFDPMCSSTMLGIYRAAKPPTCSPHPPAITWLSSSGLTGGTTRLSTHCSLTEPRTHSSFSDFSLHDLYYPTTHALHAQWGRTEQLPTGSVGRLSVLLKGSLTVVVEGGRTTSLIQHWQLHTAESSDYWSSETEKIGFQADRLTAYNRNTVMPSSCLDWLRTL